MISKELRPLTDVSAVENITELFAIKENAEFCLWLCGCLSLRSIQDAFLIPCCWGLIYISVDSLGTLGYRENQDAAILILIAAHWQRQFWLTDFLQMSALCPCITLGLSKHNITELWTDWVWMYITTPNSLDVGWWRAITNKRLFITGIRNPLSKTFFTWRRTIWTAQDDNDPLKAPSPKILDCLLQLKLSGLFISSIKVHLAAISVCHILVQSCSVFSHLSVSRFLEGLNHSYPTS